MTPGTPTKLIAASLGLAAFATATLVGLSVDNPADIILARSLVSMVIAQIVGTMLGAVAERAVREHIDAQHRVEAASAAQPAPPAQPASPGAG